LAASIGGISGLIAVILLFIYRKDRMDSQEQQRIDRKFMEDRLTEILAAYNLVCRDNQDIADKQSALLSELITYLKARNGKSHH